MTLGIPLLNKTEKALTAINLWVYEKMLAVIEAQIKIRKKAIALLSLQILDLEDDLDELEKTQANYKKHIDNLKQ